MLGALVFALAGIASTALSQPITFGNTSFTTGATVGQTWPISFNKGDGSPVSIAFGNMTWAFVITTNLTVPGTYSWNVSIPAGTVQGRYQLALVQGNATEYSPAFDLVIPPTASQSTSAYPSATVSFTESPDMVVTVTSTITAIYLPQNTTAPTVTYIYYEDACGCHRTTTCASSEMPASMSTTEVTYFETKCGCTTTVTASCAETILPVVQTLTSSCESESVAPMTSQPPVVVPASTASPSLVPTTACLTCGAITPVYTGAASRLMGATYGLAAMMVIGVVA